MNKLTTCMLVIITCLAITATSFNSFGTSNLFSKIMNEPERTTLDDANCTLQSIDEANALVVYPLLQRLVRTDFFKIFKVDLQGECPFWVMQKVCTGQGSCGVCECDDDDIPVSWKQTKVTPVNTFLGMQSKNKWTDKDVDCWTKVPDSHSMTYVNLLLNPETRTGYSGEEASRIWRAIYEENCFKSGKLDDMCLEERVFYRLLSGIHASITMKIATYYHLKNGTNATTAGYDAFEPNFQMYHYALEKFPDRVKNLYFIYTFTLRALQKAGTFFENYDYATGNKTEDVYTQKLVKKLLRDHSSHLCDNVFDEKLLFQSPDKVALLDQMKSHFRNISSIMDCVACEKCKMWAKIEILGLATALKIVLADENELPGILGGIQRNEVIALINSFKQHAQSISDLQVFRDLRWKQEISPYISYLVTGVMALVIGRLLWHLLRDQLNK
ncbi:ERO1-like protein alpha [Acrasis kona]|uniref:ERO1-like protein alpha n=1 Tax=Acrasis kona TaxID=1008807 RepID=A0AAW2ZIX2_9EUKA